MAAPLRGWRVADGRGADRTWGEDDDSPNNCWKNPCAWAGEAHHSICVMSEKRKVVTIGSRAGP